MLSWIIAVAVLVVLWGTLWKRNLILAFGIFVGLVVAWIVSKFVTPYFIGMQEIPIWLPPLPFAIVAITLFVYGALVWFRGTKQPPRDSSENTER